MFLDISQMRGARDRIDRTFAPTAFDPEQGLYQLVEPVRLAFDIFKDRSRFHLVGRVITVLEVGCSRCLEPFRLPVDAAFDLVYLPDHANVGEGEIEVDDGDLSTAFYRDETIDLGGLMREQFLLAMPMKPLCVEACRGLCQTCGTNLNIGACSCPQAWTDPRLEGLRGLSIGGDREPDR